MYTTTIFDIYDIPLKIVNQEMLNLVIAVKLWARDWAHYAVKFFCDNLAVVQVVRTGKTRDNMLALCLRNIWLSTASIDLQIDHIQVVQTRQQISLLVYTHLLGEIREAYTWHKIPMHFFDLNSII